MSKRFIKIPVNMIVIDFNGVDKNGEVCGRHVYVSKAPIPEAFFKLKTRTRTKNAWSVLVLTALLVFGTVAYYQQMEIEELSEKLEKSGEKA